MGNEKLFMDIVKSENEETGRTCNTRSRFEPFLRSDSLSMLLFKSRTKGESYH